MNIGIDADLLVYRAAFAAERMEYGISYEDAEFGESGVIWVQSAAEAKELSLKLETKGVTVLDRLDRINLEPVEAALYNAKSMIERIISSLDGEHSDAILYLSGEDNFRTNIATIKPYKGNRAKNRKPTHGPAVRAYMQKHWNCVITEDEEADDALGYTQYKYVEEGDVFGHVIVSTDKDLDMIPGLHYNFTKEVRYFVDEETARRIFWCQVLSGDDVDNIQGVVGCGVKRAKKALQDATTEEELYRAALALYVQGYGQEKAEEALLETARLIWIRRYPNQMWEPPV